MSPGAEQGDLVKGGVFLTQFRENIGLRGSFEGKSFPLHL